MRKGFTKEYAVRMIGILLFLLAAAIVFAKSNSYTLCVINQAIIYFFCSVTVVLQMGLCGQLSFATISFMGVGAFVAGQLAKNYGVTPVLAILLSVVLTGAFSYVVGKLILRLKGMFFVFGTIAIVTIFQTIFQNFKPLSGGPDGLYGLPKMVAFGIKFDNYKKWYWVLLGIALLVAWFVERIRQTSFGRAMMAVRDNEIAAQGMGVDVMSTKLVSFVMGCSIAGLGGALLCFHNGVVSYSLFTFNVQMKFLSMAMLGGVDNILGTAVGTLLIVLLPEWFRALERYMTLIYGIGIIVMMIFMPTGVAGIVKKVIFSIKYKRKSTLKQKEAEANGDA